jgi:large subunit ribosomal protein L6
MSRIGRQIIPVTAGVKVAVEPDRVSVNGPKGSLSHRLPSGITARLEGTTLSLQRRDDSKQQRALHGTARALLANAVHGVTNGFSRKLEIHGVGYGAEVKGQTATFKLGYSHPVSFPIPTGVQVVVEKNVLTVQGYDRQQVGQVAAEIRELRPPDVYKLKGIRYADERLRKKAGKTGAK